MSFKVSKRAKSILASLLITANFAHLSNSNVKSMDFTHNGTESKCNNYSDSVCITPELFKDILEVYEHHKNGKIDIIEESNKLFESINKNFFGSHLIHSFNDTHFNSNEKLVSFAPYVLGRALKAFLDKNKGFKTAIKFCHEKIKNFPFLIYGFDNNQDKSILEKIKKVLKSNGKDLCHYEDQDEFPNYADGYYESLGLSTRFRQMLALGISNISNNYYLHNASETINSENLVEQFESAFYEEYPDFRNIHPGLYDKEIKIIIGMIHTSLHEIAHHIPIYLGLLEKFDGIQKTSYPISTKSNEGGKYGYDLITANWLSALLFRGCGDNMRYVCDNLKCNDYEMRLLLSYKNSFDPYSSGYGAGCCMGARGHTDYGTTNRYEDFAESFALGSMTNEFPALTILIKKWNERAQKLVNSYDEYKCQARKYIYDFDEEYKLKKRNLQYLKEFVKNLKI